MGVVIVLLIVGIMEVVTIGRLHDLYGTYDLIIFYLSTTALGAIIAWICYDSVKKVKNKANFSNKLSKRLNECRLTAKDHATINIVTYIAVYYLGCVLIAIPGIITDILGILLVVPPINNFMTSSLFSKFYASYYERKCSKN